MKLSRNFNFTTIAVDYGDFLGPRTCSRATFHQIGYLSQLVCLVCEPINLWGRCWLFEIKSVAPCGIQTRVAWVKEVRPSQTDPTRIQIFNRYTSTNITRLLTWKMSQIFIIGCGCCKWKCWYLSLNEGSTLVLLLMWFLSLLCLKLHTLALNFYKEKR